MTFAAPLQNKSIRFRARSFVAFTLSPEAPIADWLEGLDHWIANSPGYFAGRPVVLDLNLLQPGPEEIAALVGTLARRGIRVYAIELEGAELGPELPPLLAGAKEATAEGLLGRAARKARAEELEAAAGEQAQAARETQPAAEAAPAEVSPIEMSGDEPVDPELARLEAVRIEPAQAASAGAEPAQPSAGTLMIKAPIRSGQSVFHPHGDVIVLGSVASGSEIVAGGSIHVYGTLRGRAIAGSEGNISARIFCRKNEAELLAVDGWYTTAEEMEGVSRGKAVQAFLDNDALCVVPLG
ncbi:septum formation inhibitor MinC [Mesorhizobium sp. M2D.F.Ca.ET.185.01.1.1]|uniref:septum site-determining protein MinC n=1 Tax=unclassified Mesorhizobium TaxID=325217 RepID=UPI000FCB8D8C|nr:MULTISPECIES: septum site-determining protein MinC [unclassified Mesorhizobium]TGP77112.1 septum formation inhibitor MinC [bacterium M00.F.Ca.ET.227.01.1.1]TGP84481.1 septum formation inhibitor MinC [bacterium M00.F.Ca.ET.221.01.1.1]TGP88628.1 septum formation inhibitor MinC [bacterium M00.F.Ca.ET.222.01.1.1]TGU03097.1 septum formation inhibitor MinC [bacterium M00.F.Ca.ET.163.01.1.1]TGU30859.1 septum formation inhibitor MinC [bacterium M00.F.Ca.ET.156.01.1.1]TGU45115.1 septum formation in